MKQNVNQAVSQQPAIQLPAFTEVIKIEVEVSDIFNRLRDEFPSDYKHRDLVCHAIIGTAVKSQTVGYIYNALNGYSPIIDFQVGDMVVCTEEERYERYDANLEGETVSSLEEEYKPNWKLREVTIGVCEVVEIDLYSPRKLKVRFTQDSRWKDDKKEETEKWVSHKNCTKWAATQASI